MAQQVYRANLSAKYFPFLANNWGQSIIIRGQDQDFSRQAVSSESPEKDVGIPQVFYMENVLPTVSGFQSIGYDVITPGIVGKTNAVTYELIIDGSGNTQYVMFDNTGGIYYQTLTGWAISALSIAGTVRTFAYVNGITYMYVANVGCFTWNFATNQFVAQTLTGLTPANIFGICASFGYLIAWTVNTVFWSSLIDPTDFTPSLVTGAGSESVQGAKGAITYCVQHTQGFIVYTSENAVASIYSGNANYPFNFRPIVSSGGVGSLDLIGYDANTGNHYVYSTSGLQILSTTQTQTVIPELTDFISGRVFEDFNQVSMTFSTTALNTPMKKKLNVISDRYLVMSYGVNSLTHILVYDLSLKRWGKLKIPHVDVVEYKLPSSVVVEIPKQSIAFLQADGTVVVVDYDPYIPNTQGLILLGKYQYIRGRLLTMETIQIENVMRWSGFKLTLFSSLDGKTTQTPTTLLPLNTTSQLGTFNTRITGVNHSVMLQGGFNIESMELTFHVSAKR
jgi:hypothetical protein